MSAFELTATNDFALTTDSRGKKQIRLSKDELVNGITKINLRFQLFEGEWWGDKRIGTPWYKSILVKNPDPAVISQTIKAVILSVPQIAQVEKLTYQYDNATRAFGFYFEAKAKTGQKITGGSGTPFILDGREILKRSNTL